MTQPTKAAVSRMTRLLLVFAMILSLVGGFLYSAQAKSIYNIKADSNVVTTVEGISADTGSPVVDQILEQAGIEVGSSDIVEVTVTSSEPEEDSSSPSDVDSGSTTAFVSGVASEQVVQNLTADASSPAAQNEETPDSAEAEKDAGKQSKETSEDASGKGEEKDASNEDQPKASEPEDASGQEQASEPEALNGSLAEVKAMDTALPQDAGTQSGSAPQDNASEAEQASQQENEALSSPKTGDKQKADAAESSDEEQKADKAESSDEEQKADKAESSDEGQKADEAKSSDEEQKADKAESSDEEQKADAAKSSDEEQKADAAKSSDEEQKADAASSQNSSDAQESAQGSGDKIITVTVTRPKYVTVTVDKTLTSVQLQPGDTVRDVVERLNISLGENDLVSQPLDAEPDVSAPITINRVELSYFEKVKEKDYETIRKPDPKKYIGTEYVKRKGVSYKKVDTYEKKIIDGGEPIITKVKTDVTEMKNEIVCYGTKVDSPSPSGLSASRNVITNRDEENGTITLSDGSTYSYSSVSTSFAATAYCGGGTTSTGRAAQVGVVAVDPSVIPYGTRMYITSGSTVYGVCVAGDTGVKGHLIDLYFNSASQCRAFGRRGITVYFLD